MSLLQPADLSRVSFFLRRLCSKATLAVLAVLAGALGALGAPGAGGALDSPLFRLAVLRLPVYRYDCDIFIFFIFFFVRPPPLCMSSQVQE